MMDTKPDELNFDKQGHRGCRGLMPENTIAAMRTALDLGVTTLEMDVVITKDKKRSAHFEQTVFVGKEKAEIVTE